MVAEKTRIEDLIDGLCAYRDEFRQHAESTADEFCRKVLADTVDRLNAVINQLAETTELRFLQ